MPPRPVSPETSTQRQGKARMTCSNSSTSSVRLVSKAAASCGSSSANRMLLIQRVTQSSKMVGAGASAACAASRSASSRPGCRGHSSVCQWAGRRLRWRRMRSAMAGSSPRGRAVARYQTGPRAFAETRASASALLPLRVPPRNRVRSISSIGIPPSGGGRHVLTAGSRPPARRIPWSR